MSLHFFQYNFKGIAHLSHCAICRIHLIMFELITITLFGEQWPQLIQRTWRLSLFSCSVFTEMCLFCDWPSWLLWRERIEVIVTVEHSRYRIIVNRHFDKTLHRFLNISFAFVHLAIWMAVTGWLYFTSKERNRMVYCVLIVSTFISLFFQHSSYKQCKQQGRRGLFVWGAKCFSCRKLWTCSNVRQCIGSRRVLSAHFTPGFLVGCFPFVVLFSIVSYNM